MKKSIMFAIGVGILVGCARNQGVTSSSDSQPSPKPAARLQTFTLQYRISMDAVAPSKFVAIYAKGMTMGLTIHWKIGEKNKAELDALLAGLEKSGVNGKEFAAKGKWIHEGFELEVYEIQRKF